MTELDTNDAAGSAQSADDQTTDDQNIDDQSVEDQSVEDLSADEEDVDEEEAPDEEEAAAPSETDLVARLEQEGDIAADYLEELLDIADLDGDLDIDVEADRAAVSIVGADLSQLVGQGGKVLEALQELTRLAVYRETGERSRLMLDISGFRADKRSRLTQVGADAAAQVKASGEPLSLDPMSPFERKIVHDAVAAAGLRSESEGVEPRRHVVVLPADD